MNTLVLPRKRPKNMVYVTMSKNYYNLSTLSRLLKKKKHGTENNAMCYGSIYMVLPRIPWYGKNTMVWHGSMVLFDVILNNCYI